MEFRLFDFNIYNLESNEDDSSSGSEEEKYTDKKTFEIQMFGINEKGETCSIFVKNYHPFFYIKINKKWKPSYLSKFLEHIKNKIGPYYENSIVGFKMVKKKKLYGFDGGSDHDFIEIKFKNTIALNKVKYLFYENGKLKPDGYLYQNTKTEIYEVHIPPLLRYFHIQEISPSGWIKLPKIKPIRRKTTTCNYEFEVSFDKIVPLNEKETIVPYKICSFDIEASSSHGDFPLAIKDYTKLARDMLNYMKNIDENIVETLKDIIYTAFDLKPNYIEEIQNVYPKNKIDENYIQKQFNLWIKENYKNINAETKNTILNYYNKQDDDNEYNYQKKVQKIRNNTSIIELLKSNMEHDDKINYINCSLKKYFPPLEGDKCTFIGSTFLNYGEKDPYLNHCIVLNSCSNLTTENSKIESYKTEKEVLLAWQKLIQNENPDIIIGYNIFGFDYKFMFERSIENNCVNQFLKLSRNKKELCGKNEDGKYSIAESKIVIASGEHELHYIQMNGRLQVDLYNYFRRDYNLTSYKLDYVAGEFIGDKVISIEHVETEDDELETEIYTKNMMGIYVGSYIHFEEIAHSVDNYKNGEKFEIVHIDEESKMFSIKGHENFDMSKTVRWGLAKDDVSPQDIFNLTNKGPDERGIIAKYCIQDCNLVHHLMNKIDVITGFIEMAKICSVPMNFLVMRGQGIKLTSFIAKKCREKNTLMKTIQKKDFDDGYEGAIVLDPKCNLYLDNPVACVDYASLYPSSMISENLSHDSKVWTKEYDKDNNLINVEGEQDGSGNFIYDNLPSYEYVDITYDVYKDFRESPQKAAVKIKTGIKICRWAQKKDGTKSIMPSILEELLKARKATRKLIPKQNDDFMKNILDKRQLSYKITANSLYGQCGARTSTFYEKDVAASTTATGRKLLTYAQRVIEEVYGNKICSTKNYGNVLSNAEYIYGDTDSVFFTFNLKDPETGEKIVGKKALEITIELAQQAGEIASKFLKRPHDLEYEKTFMPFCLLSKKRYVGMLYETDINKGKRKEMGIVLKRRDNAPIVKDVYGGVIDILMKEKDIVKALDFVKSKLESLLKEEINMDKLIITKSLRSNYKNPDQIAHKVLADRIAKRDPGNKPSSGDRIPFVYIQGKEKCKLQGDKIETPAFINENNLKPDYGFYISNQIMKPLLQLFSLVLEQIPEYKKQVFKIRKINNIIKDFKQTLPNDKYIKKVEDIKSKEVKQILFDPYLNKINNKKNNITTISSYFVKI
tara:strand:- start:1429 stop:5151 length:3723 start_codon:yes stop_codon:yes gene_type:complete